MILMKTVVFLVAFMATGISGQLSLIKSVADTLLSIVGTVNSYNGPESISSAPTTPTSNIIATEEDMKYYWYYAIASYCSREQLKQTSCNNCQQYKSDINTNNGVAVIENPLLNTLAFLTVSDVLEEITVTFRGTVVDLRNLLLDATLFNPGFGNNEKFHLGFYIATCSLYDDVIEALGYQLLLHPTYKLTVIGHSLGGAMARITVYFITKNNQFPNTKIGLYTYGEPRTGNIALADYFNTLPITSARCVNKRDIVPHIAPTSILGTRLLYDYYVHSQPEVWVQTGSVIFCDLNFYEDSNCSNSLNPSYSIDDHGSYFGVVRDCDEMAVTPATLPSSPPPVPTKIVNFAGGAIHFLSGLLG